MSKSDRPTIVNVTSAAGVQSTGSGAAYAADKAAVVQLTKTLAQASGPPNAGSTPSRRGHVDPTASRRRRR